jgi:hypothetical protein
MTSASRNIKVYVKLDTNNSSEGYLLSDQTCRTRFECLFKETFSILLESNNIISLQYEMIDHINQR